MLGDSVALAFVLEDSVPLAFVLGDPVPLAFCGSEFASDSYVGLVLYWAVPAEGCYVGLALY